MSHFYKYILILRFIYQFFMFFVQVCNDKFHGHQRKKFKIKKEYVNIQSTNAFFRVFLSFLTLFTVNT